MKSVGAGIASGTSSGGFFASLLDNPYFSAGFGLVGVGSGLAVARAGWRHVVDYGRRNYLITMEIPSRDKSYLWFLDWMATREGRRTQHTSVQTTFVQLENGELSSRLTLVPSTGSHYIFYKRTWIKVDRTREKNVMDISSGTPWETVTLMTVGRSRKIFEDLLTEARDLSYKNDDGNTIIFTNMGGDWRRFGMPRKRRPIHSVILDQGGEILNDAREFLNSGKWYVDRGIPYRRGYLLYGPPGCGKSSFINALAGELRLNICILNVNSRGMDNDALVHMLNIAPQRSIILIEDIDAALDRNGSAGITFSGLLNALDGIAATEGGGRIVFMTTNHYEKLLEQPALIRPGRVDIREFVGLASTLQIKRMYERFFPESTEMADVFAQKVPSDTFNMAQIQGYLMKFKNDAQGAIEGTKILSDLNQSNKP